MLRNRKRVRIHEVLRPSRHLHHLLETLWANLARGNNTVAIHYLARRRERHPREIDGVADELHGFARRTDRLEVPEGFPDPVHGAAVLAERSDGIRAAGDEHRVEEGGAHAFEVVVCYHTLARGLVLALGEDLVATGGDGEGEGAGGGQRGFDAVVGNGVVAVCYDDGDHAGGDGGFLGGVFELGEALCLLIVLGTGLFQLRGIAAHHVGDGLREVEIDFREAGRHALVDDGVIAVVELEAQGVEDVGLLGLGHGVVEELGLVLVLLELGAAHAGLDAGHFLGVVDVAAFFLCGGRGGMEAVGPVVDGALCDGVAHGAVAVEVHNGADGLVDGELLPVDAETAELGILVGEVPALEEGVIAKADAGDDVAGAEGDLFGLGEVLVDIPVELELSDVSDGDQLFRPHLGSIKDVELKVVLLGFGNDLDTELPLRVRTALNGGPEILAVEVGILSCNLQGLVPHEAVDTELGSEDELDKVPLALVVNEGVGVDTETLHHAV